MSSCVDEVLMAATAYILFVLWLVCKIMCRNLDDYVRDGVVAELKEEEERVGSRKCRATVTNDWYKTKPQQN